MKNRRTLLESDPVWKQRKREEEKRELVNKLWAIGLAVAAVLAVGFIIYRVTLPSSMTAKDKNHKPEHGLATVIDKVIDRTGSKPKYTIVFKVPNGTARWDVSEAKFKELEKGQMVVLAYDKDYVSQRLTHIYGWEPANINQKKADKQ